MQLDQLIGKWKGQCRTWFEPEVLADESEIDGEMTPVLNGRYVRHVYRSRLQGKPRAGKELMIVNSMTGNLEVVWIDDFHMNYAVMYSKGGPIADGFNIRGDYDVGQGHPKWGWRTEYVLVAPDRLIITAFNVTPEGEEAKAVETIYQRMKG